MAEYKMCLIDRNKIPFKALWIEADSFSDDIVCAVGTDFMQKIAEAEHRFICDLLNGMQQLEVVDAEPVVRCKDCVGKSSWYQDVNGFDICGMSGLYIVENNDYCSYGERKES